jgi:hydrogenase large subunit
VEDPEWSNAIERDRARTYFQAYSRAALLISASKRWLNLHAAHQDLDGVQGAG